MKQRLFSVLMALCLVLAILPAAVSATGEEPVYIKELERVGDDMVPEAVHKALMARSYFKDVSIDVVFCDAQGGALAPDTVSSGDPGICTVSPSRRYDGAFSISGIAEGTTYISFTANDKTYKSDITVSVLGGDPQGGESHHGSDPQSGDGHHGGEGTQGGNDNCSLATFTVGETEYAVGFGFERSDGMLDLYSDMSSGPSAAYVLNEGQGSYGSNDLDRFEYNIYLATVAGTEGFNTIYAKSDAYDIEISSLSLASTGGDADTFSLAAGTVQSTLAASPALSGYVYYNNCHAGSAKLTAEVSVNGEPYTIFVTFTCDAIGTDVIDLSACETISDVNNVLEAASQGFTQNMIEVRFGAKAYSAGGDGVSVITVPRLTYCNEPQSIVITGTDSGSSHTVINGSMVINSPYTSGLVTDIEFASATEGSGTALSGTAGSGAYSVYSCKFAGYATAIENSDSFISPVEGNEFRNNTVAYHVATPKLIPENQDQMHHNRFILNGTAVKVDQLGSGVTPYYFRMRDSDFMCNDVDFDIQTAGDFYLYRNYYYCESSGGLRSPQAIEGPDTRLHFYPARANSITSDDNTLIYGNENTVLNSLAGELIVSTVAPGTEINVVDDQGNGATLLATWSFAAEESGEGE